MSKILNIILGSDLRQDNANIIEQLKNSKEPLIVTQRARAAAVILSIETFEQSEHERGLLNLLAKGEKNRRNRSERNLGGNQREVIFSWSSSRPLRGESNGPESTE